MTDATLPSVIPETQPTIKSLDEEIRSLRDQISVLTSRRATLTNHLLSSETTASYLPSAPSIKSSRAAQKLSSLRSRADRASQTSLHRSLVPTTTFAAHDPSPLAVNKGHVLGIRFENYSTRTRKFGVPYYLLLNRPWMDKHGRVRKDVKIHRHTFPEWVGLRTLAHKYLPEPDEDNERAEGEERGIEDMDVGSDEQDGPTRGDREAGQKYRQDLPGLVNELRRRVTAHQQREDAINKIGDGEEVKNVSFIDAERTEATFSMRDGRSLNLVVDEAGNIMNVRCTDGNGRRRLDVEREWRGKRHMDRIS